MKALEFMRELDGPDFETPGTVDCFKYGDKEREVKKVATCLTATPNVLKRAKEIGADLIITHEPTYYTHIDEIHHSKIVDLKIAAVEEAGHLLLEYDGEPIIAAFHAMSSGKTESAEAVWGKDVVYLRSVESPYDRDAPRFEDTLTVPAEEVLSTLTGAHAGLTAGGDASEWFGEPVRTDAGTVLQIAFGDGVFTGQEIRSLFCLRSADFSVDYADGAFIFTTCGYGHAVGMSQYGADAMARRGYTFREILAHYYPGAELVEME